jgi:hypothetical protein
VLSLGVSPDVDVQGPEGKDRLRQAGTIFWRNEEYESTESALNPRCGDWIV